MGALWLPVPDEPPAYVATLPDRPWADVSLHTSGRGPRGRGESSAEAGGPLFCALSRGRDFASWAIDTAGWPAPLPRALRCVVDGRTLNVVPYPVPSVDDPTPIDLDAPRIVRHLPSEEGRWLRLPDDRWLETTTPADEAMWTLDGVDITLGRCAVRIDDAGRALLWFAFGLSKHDGEPGRCALPRDASPPAVVTLVPHEVSTRRWRREARRSWRAGP
jgi:hypothetical protein